MEHAIAAHTGPLDGFEVRHAPREVFYSVVSENRCEKSTAHADVGVDHVYRLAFVQQQRLRELTPDEASAAGDLEQTSQLSLEKTVKCKWAAQPEFKRECNQGLIVRQQTAPHSHRSNFPANTYQESLARNILVLHCSGATQRAQRHPQIEPQTQSHVLAQFHTLLWFSRLDVPRTVCLCVFFA